MSALGCRDRTAALGRHRGARSLHLFDPASGDDRSILFDDRDRRRRSDGVDGGVLVALAGRLAIVDLDDESVRTLVEIPHGDGLRLNDGVCDAAGRFWVGSMALDYAPGRGALYRYSSDGGLDRVLEDVTHLERDRLVARRRRRCTTSTRWPTGSTAFDFDLGTGEISESPSVRS